MSENWPVGMWTSEGIRTETNGFTSIQHHQSIVIGLKSSTFDKQLLIELISYTKPLYISVLLDFITNESQCYNVL